MPIHSNDIGQFVVFVCLSAFCLNDTNYSFSCMKYRANQRFPPSADDKVFLPKTLKGIQFYRCHFYFLLKRSQKGKEPSREKMEIEK